MQIYRHHTPNLEIAMFACRQDNYGFLVHEPISGQTATIDTPDEGNIMEAADQLGWSLTHIWNTHHHFDHVGGNSALKAARMTYIIGPEAERAKITEIDHGVSEGSSVSLGDIKAVVWDTPAHTLGHIAYHFEDEGVIFVGDTLFALGCGRLFEGTPQMMWDAMQRFSALDGDTRVFCAHEYTLSNGAFALSVDAGNPDLQDYMDKARALREDGQPTVPTTISAERAANPFMRAKSAHELGAIRAQKDNFKG